MDELFGFPVIETDLFQDAEEPVIVFGVLNKEKNMPKEQCKEQALFRYTWPGENEKHICLNHALELSNIARAMGFHLQLIPLSDEEQMKAICSQKSVETTE